MSRSALIIDSWPMNPAFNMPLAEAFATHTPIEVAAYDQIEDAKRLEEQYTMVVVGGVPIEASPATIYDRKDYALWLPYLRLDRLAICNTHQAVGLIFGVEVTQDEHAESGITNVEILQSHSLFRGLGQATIQLYENHQCSIPVPDGFEHLVRSVTCDNNQIMIRETDELAHVLVGSQAHLEHSPHGRIIIGNFVQDAIGKLQPIIKSHVTDAVAA